MRCKIYFASGEEEAAGKGAAETSCERDASRILYASEDARESTSKGKEERKKGEEKG